MEELGEEVICLKLNNAAVAEQLQKKGFPYINEDALKDLEELKKAKQEEAEANTKNEDVEEGSSFAKKASELF